MLQGVSSKKKFEYAKRRFIPNKNFKVFRKSEWYLKKIFDRIIHDKTSYEENLTN